MATVQIPVPMITPGSSGSAFPVLTAGTVHRLGPVPAYAIDVDSYWYGHVRVPQDYSSTPAIILSLAANATTGVATVQVATAVPADGETYNPGSYTTETNVDVTMPGTAYLRKDQSITLTSGPAAGDDLLVRVGHIGTATNDTLAATLLLVNVVFQYATA